MPIAVDTGALSAAARLQSLRASAEQQAQAVNAARGALDLEIKARQQFDQRLRSLSAQL